MNYIEITKILLRHNELIVKWVKGDLWFADPKVDEKLKEQNEIRYKELTKTLALSYKKLDELSLKHDITFINKFDGVSCVELPEELKREDVEIWLEGWKSFQDKKNK